MKLFLPTSCRYGVIIVLLSLLGSGCSELVIKENDDSSATIGKVAYRTVFAILTFGYSEVKVQEATEEYEREQKLRAYESKVMEFLNDGEITEAQAQEMIQNARARIWSEAEKQD